METPNYANPRRPIEPFASNAKVTRPNTLLVVKRPPIRTVRCGCVSGLRTGQNCTENSGPSGLASSDQYEGCKNPPKSVTISVGDTVKWTNGGEKGHTTTSGPVENPDGLWDSGVLITRESFSRTFPTAGTFQYFCKIHGEKMQATLTVQG